MEPKKAVKDRLNFLANQYGYLTPELVVEDAMNPDSPLHDQFTWDKEKAHYAYLLVEARQLIRSVKVIITTETKTVKCVGYIRDPSKDNSEQGYLSVETLRSDHDMARDALIQEFKRAGSALQRAQRLSIAFGIEEELDLLSKGIQKIRRDVEEKRIET